MHYCYAVITAVELRGSKPALEPLELPGELPFSKAAWTHSGT
jgi:hypothetical protein